MSTKENATISVKLPKMFLLKKSQLRLDTNIAMIMAINTNTMKRLMLIRVED